MGRHAGFLAATAALAQQDANFVLIPEIDVDLKGPGGFLTALETRLSQRKHAVIVVAEGAGQHFFSHEPARYDPSATSGSRTSAPFSNRKLSNGSRQKRCPSP